MAPSQTQRSQLTGVIPRVEYQESHYQFLWSVRPRFAMVNLIHGSRIAMHQQTFFPPNTSVILTSTINDGDLATYTFEDELRVIRRLEPEYAIPFDFPVYDDMPAKQRRKHIEQVAMGVRDMDYILGSLTESEIDDVCDVKDLPRSLVSGVSSTTVLPLIKGRTPEGRQVMLTTAQQIDAPVMVKYGVQYITIGGSGNFPTLKQDLELFQKQSNGYPTLVIGVLSPSGKYSLEKLPENVVAGAGLNQWRKRINPATQSPAEMRSAYAELADSVNTALNTDFSYQPEIASVSDDAPPEPLSKSPGKSVGDTLQPSISGAAGDEDYAFGGRKRSDDAINPTTSGRLGGQTSQKTENK